MSEFAPQQTDKKIITPSPKELVLKYIRYLPWVLLSVAVMLTLAWVKLRYSTPLYNVSGKLLVKDQNPYGNSAEKFGNIFGLPESDNNLNNEIEVIRSRSMAGRVVKALGAQKQYAIKGKVLTSLAHEEDLPFSWELERVTDSNRNFAVLITIKNNTQFQLNESPELYNFGQQIKLEEATFRLIPNENITFYTQELSQFYLTWATVESMSNQYSGSISVNQSEGATVLNLSYATPTTKIGLDVVNQYMLEYQKLGMEEKKQIAINTLQFIDDQLDTLQRELGGVERNLQKYREDNRVYNPELQAANSFSSIAENQRISTEQGVKIKVVDYLRRYLSDPNNDFRLVPSNLGIDEPSLVQQVAAFNQLQLQRETALKTTTAENPMIQNITASLTRLRQDILQNLENVRNSYQLSFNELNRISRQAESNIRSIPVKEKQLLEVTRRQAILQELYSFLLQKKLETAISSASTISDITILEPAKASGVPVSPNRRSIYTIALFLGLALPVGIIFLIEYLNDKISSRNDIERVTETPILGEIGHVEDAQTLVLSGNTRSYIAEQFRIIRSNLQYVIPKSEKPVILVTSTFSGEGKSFVSTNLGAALALSGKKTVLLEMDIRKPKILKGLGMNERKGITNYIVSDMRLEEIIHPVPGIDGLMVIPCGPVPPNPAEMLLDERVEEMFQELSRKFDAIIIDSAPVGLVSDAISLGSYANATVYIVRHNYTLKKQVNLIDEVFRTSKLPHLSVVINDIDTKTGYGSYYGYGYGYGYGKEGVKNDYFLNESKESKWNFFTKWFKKA